MTSGFALDERQKCIYREGEATPTNMYSAILSNQFMAWEGEAPAEPGRCQLGRSLALPNEVSFQCHFLTRVVATAEN